MLCNIKIFFTSIIEFSSKYLVCKNAFNTYSFNGERLNIIYLFESFPFLFICKLINNRRFLCFFKWLTYDRKVYSQDS